MNSHREPLTPAAERIRNILHDPPRAGWTRRSFLQTLTAAAALPLVADTPAFAQAQRSAGRVKITDLTRADIKAWQAQMCESPYQANRSLACLRKILNLAVYDWELRETNPCTRIRQFPERVRDRFYSEDEMRRIGQVLAAMEEEKKEADGFVLLIRLLATTGMRWSEVL